MDENNFNYNNNENIVNIIPEKKFEPEEHRIPMVCLRGKVLLPNVFTSFDVGRQKSLNAVNAANESASPLIFVAAQKDAKQENPELGDVYNVGVVCKIKHITRMPGDNFRVNIDTVYAAEMLSGEDNGDYFIVNIREILPEIGDILETEAYFRFVKTSFKNYIETSGTKVNKDLFMAILSFQNSNEFVNAATFNMTFKEEEKQSILEMANVKDKLFRFYELITKEIEVSKAEKEIAAKLRQNVEQNQKEFYLREQIKVIKEELGEDVDETEELKAKILAKKMPKETEEKALKEISRMEKMNSASPDYTVLRSYIDWLLDMPYTEMTEDRTDILEAEKILDEDHYGLEKVKDRIVEYLSVLKLTKKMSGSILCLAGPPGVGKTSIAKSIARALNRKFIRMSLGGVRDEAEIRGHRKTYIGAMPGRIIYAMKDAGTINPVILLDEVDKISGDLRGDPASALLEVLDPEQNNSFRDRFLEISYDLSNVLFITTANTLDTIPAPLLDRMEIIELSGYTRHEKLEIAKRYLVKKECEKNGIPTEKVSFTDDGIFEIIDMYTREAGVRSLEKQIGSICRKIARKYAETDKMKKYSIDKDEAKKLLGVEPMPDPDELMPDEVGLCTGLAWTSVGGTTLPIEVGLMSEGKGNIQLTGKLGDVMQESAKIALTYVHLNADKFGIDPKVFEKTDVHIHAPEGAVPKDGPSAGVTMATAIVSAFTGKRVSGKVAMTGEITLRGKVLMIGGLKEKALAAYRIGIRKIIIPKNNMKDLDDIPEAIRKEIKFIPVENAEEVFKNAILDW